MKESVGSCLCGTVKFSFAGEFTGFYLCHCQYCRKDTGSAHAANLFSPSIRLRWLSGKDNVKTFTLPGTRHCRSFCQQCGSALPVVQVTESFTQIPAGCLNSQIAIKPTAHIFTGSRAEWDAGLEHVVAFDAMPGGID